MELLQTDLPRVFSFKDENKQETVLQDIGIDQKPEDILNFYSLTYPLLATAKIVGPIIQEDKVCYEFVPILGTKG